ncbi:PadR family transcriptional regulator [candidate division KSB1 bacterium]
MGLLSRIDEVYLLAILELKDEAYGVPIKKNVSKKLRKVLSYGGLYFELDQLVKKGLVEKIEGEPTKKRGGRRKFYYRLTDHGRKSLKETYEHQKSLWEGISDVVFD